MSRLILLEAHESASAVTFHQAHGNSLQYVHVRLQPLPAHVKMLSLMHFIRHACQAQLV